MEWMEGLLGFTAWIGSLVIMGYFFRDKRQSKTS